jgi:hypothetical protein
MTVSNNNARWRFSLVEINRVQTIAYSLGKSYFSQAIRQLDKALFIVLIKRAAPTELNN